MPPPATPYIDQINAIPKYVASRTLSEATWNGTLPGPDIVGAIEQRKAQPGKDLFKMGTGALTTHSCGRASSTNSACGHARRGRHRPAPVRRRRHLVPGARAHRRPASSPTARSSSPTFPADKAGTRPVMNRQPVRARRSIRSTHMRRSQSLRRPRAVCVEADWHGHGPAQADCRRRIIKTSAPRATSPSAAPALPLRRVSRPRWWCALLCAESEAGRDLPRWA